MRHSYCTVVRDPSTLLDFFKRERVYFGRLSSNGEGQCSSVKVTGIVLLTFGGTDLDDVGGYWDGWKKQSEWRRSSMYCEARHSL